MENSKDWHQEGNSSALDDGQATTKSALDKSDESSDENHSRDDVATCWILVVHAEGGREDEWDGHDGADHGQVVLNGQEEAHVPGRIVVHPVRDS